MTTLSDDEIAAGLTGLDGWETVGADAGGPAITRQYKVAKFPDAVALVVRTAYEAEAADHHPDIDIRWRTLHFTLSTHSEGGVTSKDLALAGTINEIADRHA